jgi:predicted tellurium resistance membrane protein TerC
MISPSTQRSIFRLIHIILAIPIVGYVYSPFENLPDYAPVVRYIALPVMVITGLWMWKGHWVKRLFSRRPAQQNA